jgi:hypothetical protein
MAAELQRVGLSFGKHRHQPIADVPAGYLRWLLDTLPVDGVLAVLLRAELKRRPPSKSKQRRRGAGV